MDPLYFDSLTNKNPSHHLSVVRYYYLRKRPYHHSSFDKKRLFYFYNPCVRFRFQKGRTFKIVRCRLKSDNSKWTQSHLLPSTNCSISPEKIIKNIINEIVGRSIVLRAEKYLRSHRYMVAKSSGSCPMDYGSLSGLWVAPLVITLLKYENGRIIISYSLDNSQADYRSVDCRNDLIFFSPFPYRSIVGPKSEKIRLENARIEYYFDIAA